MTDEYIRRDTALRAVTKRYGACRSPAQNRLLDEIRNEIRRAPAADVVPVVRCRACKYLVDATINANGFLICDISDMEIAPDDFCSYGEYQTNTGGNGNVSG